MGIKQRNMKWFKNSHSPHITKEKELKWDLELETWTLMLCFHFSFSLLLFHHIDLISWQFSPPTHSSLIIPQDTIPDTTQHESLQVSYLNFLCPNSHTFILSHQLHSIPFHSPTNMSILTHPFPLSLHFIPSKATSNQRASKNSTDATIKNPAILQT